MSSSQDEQRDLSLLNIFEVKEEAGPRHYVCFLDPVLAGAIGIAEEAIVGEFTPTPDGEFDPETFRLNARFVEAFERYMNDQAIDNEELQALASQQPANRLFLVDPRQADDPDAEVGDTNVIGHFQVDPIGVLMPDSFQYNERHLLFDPELGVSGILFDRQFYLWLHPLDQLSQPEEEAEPGPNQPD